MIENRRRCLFMLLMVLLSGQVGSAQTPKSFFGSVPTGQPTNTVLDLSIKDAISRALKYNLGTIESGQAERAAHALRLRNLNALLPNLSARLNESLEQANLKARGFNPNIPGVRIPTVVGPFAVQDARVYLSQDLFNSSNTKNWKAASEFEKASQYTYKRDRDMVVFTAGHAYLLVISDMATTDSIRARVQTAQTLYDNAINQNKQGVIASIDVLRARVELQTEQQRLISAKNQLSTDKLALARVIGFPNAQQFRLTDSVPFAPPDSIILDDSLTQARTTRADYLSAQAQLKTAELARRAAVAEKYPSLSMDTNYGIVGSPNLGTSHGTFSFTLGVNVPIFQGTRVSADKLQAESVLEQRRAELEDLSGRIDEEVRTAFLNIESSSELVMVAKSNIDLANQTLTQAQDRFRAGVADNLEVVQAQEAVALANQSYIAGSYSFNVAKLSLALAIGLAEQSGLQYLGVK
jgi:outer membrane protein TolC